MGMEGRLRQVSEFEMAAYKKNPGKLRQDAHARHTTPDVERLASFMSEVQKTPMMERIKQRAMQGLPPDPEDIKAYRAQIDNLLKDNAEGFADLQSSHVVVSKDGRELCLHKSWHCLHFLFTGNAGGSGGSHLGEAILGGREIGGDAADMGYGPPRALSPAQVRNVAAALDAFPIEERVRQFNPVAADNAGIYVAQHEAEELKDYFIMLRNFYADAASKGNGMLLWIE
jgi:hypothetical protein